MNAESRTSQNKLDARTTSCAMRKVQLYLAVVKCHRITCPRQSHVFYQNPIVVSRCDAVLTVFRPKTWHSERCTPANGNVGLTLRDLVLTEVRACLRRIGIPRNL